MALVLGRGGRRASLNAWTASALYVAWYFESDIGGTPFPAGPATSNVTLADLAAWEVQTPGTNGYQRVRLDTLLGAVASNAAGYEEKTNPSDIVAFTTTGPLAQTVTADKQITHVVLTTQQTANTSNPDHVIKFGPCTTTTPAVTAFLTGDSLRVRAGKASLRQS